MLILEHVIESKLFLNCYREVLQKYMQYGARSSKKVDYFHEFIKSQIENVLCNKEMYQVKLEQNVVSMNAKQRKKCDIVAYKNDKPYIVFPVKLIMTNYKQNKNNAWENLTGEIMHLKWANSDDFHIIPINIYMNQVPYLDKNKTIKKFEKISYNDIKPYEILKEKQLTYDMINYIIDVEYNDVESCKIGDIYCKAPYVASFNTHTPYRSFHDILKKLM